MYACVHMCVHMIYVCTCVHACVCVCVGVCKMEVRRQLSGVCFLLLPLPVFQNGSEIIKLEQWTIELFSFEKIILNTFFELGSFYVVLAVLEPAV